MAAMITSDTLDKVSGVGHGFFTRQGGVSDGVYASLNCGFGSGDEPERIAVNRARAMDRLGLSGEALATVYQIHSTTVAIADGVWPLEDRPRADAMVTRNPGVALGVLTADCAPVLFADGRAGIAGAAHAGWRGALDGVLEATVEAMTGLGARAADIVASVGPCIGPKSYEIGLEFHAEFTAADPGNGAFFSPSGRDGHHLFDLPAYVGRRLDGLGLAAVEVLDCDTCADEERFFSYRRVTKQGGGDFGRGLSAIVLQG